MVDLDSFRELMNDEDLEVGQIREGTILPRLITSASFPCDAYGPWVGLLYTRTLARSAIVDRVVENGEEMGKGPQH